MAGGLIYGAENTSVVWPPVGVDVYVKWNRADEWTWIPFITPVSGYNAVSAVGQMTFRYDFGYIKFAELSDFDTWDPYTINGAFIAVVAWDWWGSALVWEGVVDLETVKPHGNADITSGEQTFTAFTLEQLLDRVPIDGAYIQDWDASVQRIDRRMRFNKRGETGLSLTGNKSSSGNVFGGDGDTWTGLDICDYLINYFAPGNIEWVGVGQTAGLVQIEEEYECEGMTVLELLNRVIDKKRGLAWTCVSDGGPTVYIYVFSMAAISYGFGDAFVEANPDQQIIDFTLQRNVQPTYTFNNLGSYDQIKVKGGPIVSMLSLSYGDGTLEEGWSTEEQDDYDAGSTTEGASPEEHDAARGAERFSNVYAKHNVPADWAGTVQDGLGGTSGEDGTMEPLNALPGYWPDGTPDETIQGVLLRLDKRFERALLVEAPGSTDDTPVYRRAFAVLLADPAGTYDPEDPETPDERVYVYADKLHDVMEDAPDVEFNVDDRAMAVFLRGRPQHVVAKYTFDDEAHETGKAPQVDYKTMIATVALRTDMQITATFVLPSNAENGRTKLINDWDAEAWYVVPGTVVDVEDGALVRHEGGWIRDDSERLRQKAVLAAVWFGRPRATLSYEIGTISLLHNIGQMIRGTVGPEGYTAVETVVTRVEWTFNPQGCSTLVTTGFEEIDFPVKKPKGRFLGKAAGV